MSSRHQIERALRRAETRDRKRQKRMRVSGKNVFNLSRLIGKR